MTLVMGAFPHRCPGPGCAICAWLLRRMSDTEDPPVLRAHSVYIPARSVPEEA